MIDLCVDARMAFSSGIGTCIRHIVPFFRAPPFRTILLVDRLGQPWGEGFEQVLFTFPVYSVSEQIAFPVKIPRCDLFWSPNYNVPLLPIRAQKKVVTIHDACHLALGQYWSLPKRIYAKCIMHKALHGSDAVITDSQFSKNELIRLLGRPPRDVHVIPAAVDRDHFRRISDHKILGQIRKRYCLPEKFVLFVGNLKPHKNLARLVEAFLAASLTNWKLVLVGNNKNRFIESDQIVILDQVSNEDLPALYSMAGLFAFPSLYEGFGLPPLEAMSCGCPTIVSSAASIPEVCGKASLYFHPEQVEEITEALKRAAIDEELRKELSGKGFERVREFDWERTAEAYLNLFLQMNR